MKINPTVVPAYLSRALAHDRLGKFSEGIDDATRAIQLDEASAAAHLVRGVLSEHHGDHSSAIADLTRAIELDNRLALAYHERGMAYTLCADYARALQDCNEFVKLEPGNAQAYANRSIVYHFMGEVEQALTDYAQALRIDPKRMMTGWNESLAESARSQATQRLADYIDGLRHEAPAEQPPRREFRIVTVPEGSAAPKPRKAAAEKPVKSQPAARHDETIEFRKTPANPDAPIPLVPAPEEEGRDPCRFGPRRKPRTEEPVADFELWAKRPGRSPGRASRKTGPRCGARTKWRRPTRARNSSSTRVLAKNSRLPLSRKSPSRCRFRRKAGPGGNRLPENQLPSQKPRAPLRPPGPR